MKTELEVLAEEISRCRKCPLGGQRTRAVPGEGGVRARVFFIGEAPGSNEDRTGRPFCGAAGRILDELLVSIRLPRSEVFIGNMLKCRPPDNRDPEEAEKTACAPWLERQLALVSPKVVCCLGNHATAHVLKRYGITENFEGISRVHGQVFSQGDLFGFTRIIPLYHPAVATYRAPMKEVLLRDFQAIRRCLDED